MGPDQRSGELKSVSRPELVKAQRPERLLTQLVTRQNL